jgi:hypothetical protein
LLLLCGRFFLSARTTTTKRTDGRTAAVAVILFLFLQQTHGAKDFYF